MRLRVVLVVCSALVACSTVHENLVGDADSGKPNAADSGSTTRDAGKAPGTIDSGTLPDSGPSTGARCGKRACACDDGADNDTDNLPDGLDPECTGAYDDDESSFATGQPNKQSQCRDCFWDDNSGSGDDGCRYPAECLTGTQTSGRGNCDSCEPTAGCIERCQARTPNGCDCFGCCEVVRPDGLHVFVELTESCNLQRLDDLASCPRCVQNTACVNPCGRCELCLGKTVADLPRDCSGSSGPGYACEDGLSVCGAQSPCRTGLYCQQGCCLVDLL